MLVGPALAHHAGQECGNAIGAPMTLSAAGTLPPLSVTTRASLASMRVSVSISPDREALMNAETSSACFGSIALAAPRAGVSPFGRASRTRVRARLASWRHAASFRPKAAATCANE